MSGIPHEEVGWKRRQQCRLLIVDELVEDGKKVWEGAAGGGSGEFEMDCFLLCLHTSSKKILVVRLLLSCSSQYEYSTVSSGLPLCCTSVLRTLSHAVFDDDRTFQEIGNLL